MREQEKKQVGLELAVMLIGEVKTRMALFEQIDEVKSLDRLLQFLERLRFGLKSLTEQSQSHSHEDHMSGMLILR